MRALLTVLLALVLLPLTTGAQNMASAGPAAAVAREIPDDYASLHCIGIRWFVAGDANANARVNVAYRKAGGGDWKPAMPLFRVEYEALEKDAPPAGTNLFAGSIFGLLPGTDYEVKLAMIDPDGGSTEKVIKRTTWSEPVAAAPQRTVYAAPGDGGGKGTAGDPWLGLASVKLRPGDLLLLKAGKYAGPFTPPSGKVDAPVVIRGPAEGRPAIIDNDGKGTAVRLYKASYVFLEDLTIQGAGMAVATSGAKHLVIRRCRILDCKNGIYDDSGAERLFISDNVFTGRVTPGSRPAGEPRAVQLSGSGHVV